MLLRTKGECHARCGRAGNDIDLLEGTLKVLGDDPADLLRLVKIGIIEAGGKRVGTHENSPLDFLAKPFTARALIEIFQVCWRVAPIAKPDPIISRQISRGFGRCDHIISRNSVVAMGQVNILQYGAGSLQLGQGGHHIFSNPTIEVVIEILPRQSNSEPIHISA